ncbi:FAD:protein FMN transferase [Salegentibacter sp. HM20]
MKKLLLLFFFASVVISCKDENSQRIATGEALGTTYQIKYYSEKEIELNKALDSIFRSINQSMSTYLPDSDISRINAGDSSIQVDENFREVFKASEKVYTQSGGFFDPTVGNLVNAYGFGADKPLKRLDSIQLDSLKGLVGFDKVQLSRDNRIKFENRGMYLEFNAIAKGFTLDVIARYLDGKNVINYLIELGGELVAKGRNLEKDSDWIVAIDDPNQKEGERKLFTILALKDRAMASSGNYRKFRTDSVSGQRFVHTINPITGRAEQSNLLSVSVLAENCMLADAYATAFMALGYERSLEMLENLEMVDVYFIYSEADGEEIKTFASPGFEQALIED